MIRIKKTILQRSGMINHNANIEPDLIINGLKNYNRVNPNPMFFNPSPNPVIDTLRKFNLSIFQPVSNAQNPK